MAITITKQPVNQAVFTNGYAVFTVEATGDGLTYQWQHHTATGSTWMNTSSTGSTTDTMTIKAQAYRVGYRYRCMIADSSGAVVYSDIAVLQIVDAGSQKGVVSWESLRDIADAIRAKTETTETMLPSEMAAMIAAIKAGGEFYTGTFTGPTTTMEVSLGVSLPTFTNYCFMIVNTENGNRQGGLKSVIDGVTTNLCYVAGNTNTKVWNIDFAAGTIQNQDFTSTSGNVYRWCYFEVEGASA